MYIENWPWPRIIVTDRNQYYVNLNSTGGITVCKTSLFPPYGWQIQPLLTLPPSEAIENVDIADFDPFIVVSTLTKRGLNSSSPDMYARNTLVTLGNEDLQVFNQITNIICGVNCNFNNQFIGGHIVDSAGNLDLNCIVWSGIGNFFLSPFDDVTSGYTRVSQLGSGSLTGVVHRILKLGNKFVVYTDSGKRLFAPESVENTFTYSNFPLDGLGIKWSTHVAGDETIHGYVDLANDFNVVETNGKVTRIGYKEFIKPMVEFVHPTRRSDLIVSYLPRDRRFYLSNGNECLIINKYGAYKCHQLVSSIIDGFDGKLYGTFFDTGDREARITTDNLSFGSRGIKSVESITSDLDHASNSRAFYSVDWRMNSTKGFTSSKPKFDGPSGEAGIHVAGTDFRIKIKLNEYRNSSLTNILVNVKYSEQRFKRGTVPSQYFTSKGEDV